MTRLIRRLRTCMAVLCWPACSNVAGVGEAPLPEETLDASVPPNGDAAAGVHEPQLSNDAAAWLGADAASSQPDAAQPDADAAQLVPLEFRNLRVEELSATRAVIRFDTSRPTSCEAEFGIDATSLDRSATDPDMAEGERSLDHEVPLEDLLPETTYSYRAVASDAKGNVYSSALQSFTTRPALETHDWVNVALTTAGTSIAGKSSNYGGGADDSSFGALNAIDGKMATEWSSDGDGDNAWLELDLGQSRTLVGCGFRSRMMTDGSSIVTSIEVLLDGETRLGPFSTPDHTRVYRFDFAEPVVASRVRLQVRSSTGGNTGAREVQLFSTP